MFLASFPAGPWQANCYLLAPERGRECLIVDPGMDAFEQVESLLAAHELTPAGVLLTHGHIDHVASAARLADAHRVPCWLHPDDRELLTDPLAGLDPAGGALLRPLLAGLGLAEPVDLRPVAGGDVVSAAGLDLAVIHAPGHRPGCVLFELAYPGHPEVTSVVFSGDVLFAGSIGRTDLPGGDWEAMVDSLATRVLPLADTAAVLPGHGPQTTMARERATNPYLQPDVLRNR